MKFNETKFLEIVQKIHLKPEEIPIYSSIPDSEVRKKLNEFVDHGDNPRFSKALDEICANLVGRTLFKILITKMISDDTLKSREKVKIIEYDGDGSRYSPLSSDFAIKINFNFYDDDDIGIEERQYYCIDETGTIKTKLKSLTGSIFHEFCHCLHDVSGTRMGFACSASVKLRTIWGKDEEIRTITCYHHDPICDHCFDFCQSILKRTRFYPRYGHNKRYIKSAPAMDAKNRDELSKNFHESKVLMDGWKEYMIP
jgi:hypothetical protein